MTTIYEIDKMAIDFFTYNVNRPYLDSIMKLITSLGNKGIIFILLTLLILLLGKKYRNLFYTCTISLLLSGILCNLLLKPSVARIRPYDALSLTIIIDRLKDYSFPSGHTTAAFAFGVSVLLYNKRVGLGFIFFGILMGFTRLYLHVHYFTDVLGGILLGSFCALVSYYIVKKTLSKRTS